MQSKRKILQLQVWIVAEIYIQKYNNNNNDNDSNYSYNYRKNKKKNKNIHQKYSIEKIKKKPYSIWNIRQPMLLRSSCLSAGDFVLNISTKIVVTRQFSILNE